MENNFSENSSLYRSERLLVASVQRGNKEAFESLYDKYAPALMGLIYQVTRDQKSAEEILQKAFFEVAGRIKNFDPSRERLFSWMTKIARDLAACAPVNTPKNKLNSKIHLAGNFVDTNEAVVSEAVKGHAAELLSTASARSQCSALTLVYVRGFTAEEAAKELGVSGEELKIKLRTEINQLRGITAE